MSAFSSTYHDYVSTICFAADVITVSVECGSSRPGPYPLATRTPGSLSNGSPPMNGTRPDQWLNEYADLNCIFVGGNSTGGTDNEMWLYINKENEGLQDRRLKPAVEDLGQFRCEKVLVFGGGERPFEWSGEEICGGAEEEWVERSVEMKENKGKDHYFHLYETKDEEAVDLVKTVCSWFQVLDQPR